MVVHVQLYHKIFMVLVSFKLLPVPYIQRRMDTSQFQTIDCKNATQIENNKSEFLQLSSNFTLIHSIISNEFEFGYYEWVSEWVGWLNQFDRKYCEDFFFSIDRIGFNIIV